MLIDTLRNNQLDTGVVLTDNEEFFFQFTLGDYVDKYDFMSIETLDEDVDPEV